MPVQDFIKNQKEIKAIQWIAGGRPLHSASQYSQTRQGLSKATATINTVINNSASPGLLGVRMAY